MQVGRRRMHGVLRPSAKQVACGRERRRQEAGLRPGGAPVFPGRMMRTLLTLAVLAPAAYVTGGSSGKLDEEKIAGDIACEMCGLVAVRCHYASAWSTAYSPNAIPSPLLHPSPTSLLLCSRANP